MATDPFAIPILYNSVVRNNHSTRQVNIISDPNATIKIDTHQFQKRYSIFGIHGPIARTDIINIGTISANQNEIPANQYTAK